MKQLRFSVPVKFAIAASFGILVFLLVWAQVECNALEEERTKLTADVKKIQGEVDELQNRLDMPFDDEYIIAIAKEQLGYCLPDEVIFKSELVN